MAVKIITVMSESLAKKSGIKPGDTLISINDEEINDMLDLQFYQTNKSLDIVLTDKNGKQKNVVIPLKKEYEPLGLEFETYLIDTHHFCKNKCMFCFIDQLPKGLRESLYFKDDDERLSFLFGNYITLTNLTQREIDRIKKIRISPINISVHTTNPELRVKMMQNPTAANIKEKMQEFAQAGIKMNCQIVLCKDVNDGIELKNTIGDLQNLYPAVQSVSIVPIGLTRYREYLETVQTFDKYSAQGVIDLVESATEKFHKQNQTRLVYLSDEFYLKAGEEIPKAEYYEDFPQIENGVGMVRTFIDNFQAELDFCDTAKTAVSVDIATGESFYPIIKQMLDKAVIKYDKKLSVTVHKIKNNFFGGNVSVTGLLTGADLVFQLENKLSSTRLCLCKDMLRNEGDLFLDDMTPEQVEEKLDTHIEFYTGDGYDLLSGILKEV